MKPDVGLFVAEPGKHTVIVKALVAIAWYSKITDCFDCIRRYALDSRPNQC